jgi:hypothetical protein
MKKKTLQIIILSHQKRKSLERKMKKVKARKHFHHQKGEDQEKQTNKEKRKHFQHSQKLMNAIS